MFKQSRSIVCKIFSEDINNFCLYNPFRYSRGLLFLFAKYYNIYGGDFHKQSKIFYKRLLFVRKKNFSKKYFKTIRLLKKKLLLFFNFRTFKQLNYFFNYLYFQKSIFLFNYFLCRLELRADFFLYRLRIVFAISEARNFIQKNGFIVDQELFYDYNKIIEIGSVFTLNCKEKLIFYLKFYYFWFNEYIYSNKLINLKLINKIIILKKIKKKRYFFREFFRKELFFFFNIFKFNNFIFVKKNNVLNSNLIDILQNKFDTFVFEILKFSKIFKLVGELCKNLLLIHFYYFLIFQKLFFILIFNKILNFIVNMNMQNFKFFVSNKKAMIVPNFNFLSFLNFFIYNLKLKIFNFKFKFFNQIDFCNNIKGVFNNKIFYKFSLLTLSKKKYLRTVKYIRSLDQTIENNLQLINLHRIEVNPKLRNIFQSWIYKFKVFFFKTKYFLAKRKKLLKYRIISLRKKFDINNINKHIKFFQLFRFFYKKYNFIYHDSFDINNKIRFFSYYERVNDGIERNYVHNREFFEDLTDPLIKFTTFFQKKNSFSNQYFDQNLFQYQLNHELLKLNDNSLFTKMLDFYFENQFFRFFFFKLRSESYTNFFFLNVN